ncbi:MAG: hypothetical protein RSD17_00830 [Oscillospiraceae bacterium]
MNEHVKLMYPKMNTNEVAMFYNKKTKEFIIGKNLNAESGQYETELHFTNPLEAWTSYNDSLDSIVRKQILSKYTKEELGLVDVEENEEEAETNATVQLQNGQQGNEP